MSGTYKVSMGDRGRLVVPAEVRAGGGFDQGDILVLIDSPGGVVMVSRDRLRDIVRRDLADHDLVDDLIKDRREAARRDQDVRSGLFGGEV